MSLDQDSASEWRAGYAGGVSEYMIDAARRALEHAGSDILIVSMRGTGELMAYACSARIHCPSALDGMSRLVSAMAEAVRRRLDGLGAPRAVHIVFRGRLGSSRVSEALLLPRDESSILHLWLGNGSFGRVRSRLEVIEKDADDINLAVLIYGRGGRL